MAISIKNESVSRLVTELAKELDTSITEAVGVAVKEKLDRVHEQSSRKGIAEKLMAIGKKCAKHAPKDWLTRDYDAELYDEMGLPRSDR